MSRNSSIIVTMLYLLLPLLVYIIYAQTHTLSQFVFFCLIVYIETVAHILSSALFSLFQCFHFCSLCWRDAEQTEIIRSIQLHHHLHITLQLYEDTILSRPCHKCPLYIHKWLQRISFVLNLQREDLQNSRKWTANKSHKVKTTLHTLTHLSRLF